MGDTQENSKNSLEWPKPPLEILFELKTKEKDVGEGQLWEVTRKSRANNSKICFAGSVASLLIRVSRDFESSFSLVQDRRNLYKWRSLLLI